MCHKELLKAHSFLLNQVYREAQIGASEAPGGERGSAWAELQPPQSPLLYASAPEFLLSHVEAGQWGWDVGQPHSLLLALSVSRCRGSEKGMQEIEFFF